MTITRFVFAITLICASVWAQAQSPSLNAPLPALSISDRGELKYDDDDFTFVPWTSDNAAGKVHVVQYLGATKSGSETFKPFTDRLGDAFEPGTIVVTTIVNLDAAMWGTTGFVLSELKKNKRQHPQATMVLDEAGSGVKKWSLGKKGTALAITDESGVVKFFTTEALSPEEVEATLALVRATIDS